MTYLQVQTTLPGGDTDSDFEHHQEQPLDEVDLSSTDGAHEAVAISDDDLYQRPSMIESSVSATGAADVLEKEDATLPSKGTQRVPIPSPVGYSQFDFITQDFTPQAARQEENYDSLQASPASGSEQQRDNDPSTQNSPSNYVQSNTFSQESIGNAYAPMGDSSDEDLEGYAPSMPPPAHARSSFNKMADVTTASESASSTTVDPCDGERDPFTPSSHGSGEEISSHADMSAFGESQGSIRTTSSFTAVDDDDDFGTSFASGNQIVQDEFGASRESLSSASLMGGDVEADTFSGFEERVSTTPEAFVSNSSELAIEVPASSLEDDANDFGDFGTAPSSAPHATSVQFTSTASSSANASGGGDADAFGNFSHGTFTSEDDDFGNFGQSSHATEDDDDFGDFGQSSSADDDFGDFGQSSSADNNFTNFQQLSSFGQSAGFNTAVSDDDDFGDFSAPQQSAAAAATSFASVTMPPAPPSIYAPSTSTPDLQNFFKQAFSVEISPSSMDFSLSAANFHSQKTNEIFQEKGRSDVLVERIFREAVETYFADAGADAVDPVPTGAEHYLSELKATRLKHLKYVLTEKIQEAARHDGIFPHGSQQHHVLLSLVNSDDEQKMRNALTSVQNSLFTSSVNDAMMRMARQAALSAKAKIAEQAAQQQASSRGSLLATTRQLLSRTAGTSSSASDSHRASAPCLSLSSSSTPTSASIHKISRFAFTGSTDHQAEGAAGASSSSANGYNSSSSGDETSNDGGDSSHRHSSGSHEPDFNPSSSRNSSSGGLMKKFQDRFSSFSASRSRARTVSLRRKGQSGEDVRKMELNMDSISGGFDEVKWKCAVFLYDVEEVAHVAPSQIKILAYPSKEVLAGKSDRTVLMKFLKPGAIWTIDIGASNNDVLNEW
uniref:Uncharacterized protein n=1 Tax=Globisporangium ultimum (strain ATCC 200006 / CBS 805.95 / DAOM BR144) TaxID=431595 RepID=K3WEK6_GLOUD